MEESERFAKYINEPVGFFKDILKVELVHLQKKALELLLVPPYAVLCPSCNSYGKSMMAAGAVIWWHCTRIPSKVITTAPTKESVETILWAEVRRLAEQAALELAFMPRAPKIRRGPNDFAVGMTAKSEEAMKGKHGPNQFFIFDESVGILPEIWDALEQMFSPPGHAWLVLYNPNDTGSRAFLEQNGYSGRQKSEHSWHVVRMSALEHPNLDLELRGEPPLIPDRHHLAARLGDGILRAHAADAKVAEARSESRDHALRPVPPAGPARRLERWGLDVRDAGGAGAPGHPLGDSGNRLRRRRRR